MDDIRQALAAAVRMHRAGNLAEAQRVYREILARQPAHPDALHLLGVAALQQGRPQEAVELLARAVDATPNNAIYLTHLGTAYAALKQWDQAADSLRRALALRQDLFVVHNNLGSVYQAQQKHAEAAASYQRALQLSPDSAEAYNNLGCTLQAAGRFDEALSSFEQAWRLDPQLAAGQNHPVVTLDRLGVAALQQGRPAEAVRLLSRAVEAMPVNEVYLTHLGTAYAELQQWDRAADVLQRAVAANPKAGDAHYILGNVMNNQGQLEGAAASFERAVALDPARPDAYYNLGNCWKNLGRYEAAERCYREAIRLKPDYAEAHNNLAFVLLSRGDFANAWPEYEWRLKRSDYRGLKLDEPPWNGSPLGERSLLVHAEQGLGDTLQFIRFVPLVRQRGDHVTFLVPKVLVPLLTKCGYENLVAIANSAEFDVQAPLLSVPGILGTTLETIPNDVPYLAADPQLIERWRRRLAAFEGFKIGVVWRGDPGYVHDRSRSIPLAAYEPIAKVPGVRLFSLQKGPGTEEIAAAAEQVPLIDLGPELDLDTGAFMDTAAVMKCLDLVIAPDTAPAHLAGGLAVPTWLAVPRYAEWRWMIDRDDSPWYPTMRLFRQSKPRDWDDVFRRMAAALARLAAAR